MKAEKDKLEDLPPNSEELKTLVEQLKSLVCNTAQQKVCCEVQPDETEDPAFLPSLETEQCGLGGGTAGFIRPESNTRKKLQLQLTLTSVLPHTTHHDSS